MKTSIVVDLDNQPIAAPTITTDNGLEVNAAVYDVDGPSSTADQMYVSFDRPSSKRSANPELQFDLSQPREDCRMLFLSWDLGTRSVCQETLGPLFSPSSALTLTYGARPDALDFDPACYCGPGVATSSDGQCTGTGSTANLLSEWGEWYLDIHSPACIAKITPIMQARMTSFKDKGCDAVDPDNVDSVRVYVICRWHR